MRAAYAVTEEVKAVEMVEVEKREEKVVAKRHARYEDLTAEQKAFFDMLDEEAQEMFLSVMPEKREAGASKKQKVTTLEKRLAGATAIYIAIEAYRNRLGQLIARLNSGDVPAKEVDLRLHTLPKVEGVVLRFEGKPRGPKSKAEDEAIAA